MSPADISPDGGFGPPAHVMHPPSPLQRGQPQPRPHNMDMNREPPRRQSRWGAPVDHLPPHARDPLLVDRPPPGARLMERGYAPPRDYRDAPPQGRGPPPGRDGSRPPHGWVSPGPRGLGPRPLAPHLRDGPGMREGFGPRPPAPHLRDGREGLGPRPLAPHLRDGPGMREGFGPPEPHLRDPGPEHYRPAPVSAQV